MWIGNNLCVILESVISMDSDICIHGKYRLAVSKLVNIDWVVNQAGGPDSPLPIFALKRCTDRQRFCSFSGLDLRVVGPISPGEEVK